MRPRWRAGVEVGPPSPSRQAYAGRPGARPRASGRSGSAEQVALIGGRVRAVRRLRRGVVRARRPLRGDRCGSSACSPWTRAMSPASSLVGQGLALHAVRQPFSQSPAFAYGRRIEGRRRRSCRARRTRMHGSSPQCRLPSGPALRQFRLGSLAASVAKCVRHARLSCVRVAGDPRLEVLAHRHARADVVYSWFMPVQFVDDRRAVRAARRSPVRRLRAARRRAPGRPWPSRSRGPRCTLLPPTRAPRARPPPLARVLRITMFPSSSRRPAPAPARPTAVFAPPSSADGAVSHTTMPPASAAAPTPSATVATFPALSARCFALRDAVRGALGSRSWGSSRASHCTSTSR